jgi:hypothetical protein
MEHICAMLLCFASFHIGIFLGLDVLADRLEQRCWPPMIEIGRALKVVSIPTMYSRLGGWQYVSQSAIVVFVVGQLNMHGLPI